MAEEAEMTRVASIAESQVTLLGTAELREDQEADQMSETSY